MKTLPVILFIVVSFSLAQQQILLRINEQGVQEAIPIDKDQNAQAVIERLEQRKHSASTTAQPDQSFGIVDKLKNYDSTNTASNFGFNHQDVGLAWFRPEAFGKVKSFVWHNYGLKGDIGKATIRAWKVDTRLLSLPSTAGAGGSRSAMGYYIDANDSDGNVTPFKKTATDTVFKPAIGNPDSEFVSFDPLGKEADWLPNGIQVQLDSAQWQSINVENYGLPFTFSYNEPVGFTIQNDSPPGGTDARMEMWAFGNTAFPYHSLKFYEAARSGNKGWHIRGDFEWQWYVIVEYQENPLPKITLTSLRPTTSTAPRLIEGKYTNIVPYSTLESLTVMVKYKINKTNWIQVKMVLDTAKKRFYTYLPGANPGDTVSYYTIVSDTRGYVSTSQTTSYFVLSLTHDILLIYNGRSLQNGYTAENFLKYYMNVPQNNPPTFDWWDAKGFGLPDSTELLSRYDRIIEVTGDGGYYDLTYLAGKWLKKGTPQKPKWFFTSDQDRGFINNPIDTSFNPGDPYYDYFGIWNFVDMDYPYMKNGNKNVTKPWKIDYDSSEIEHPLVKSIAEYEKTNNATLWYHPNYEHPPFLNWLDEILPTPGTKVLFRDKTYGNKPLGVAKDAPDGSWHTMFFTFDWASLNFRSDTSTTLYPAPADDPKYKSLVSVINFGQKFIEMTTGAAQEEQLPSLSYSLFQNYPNPFNPSTTIEYQIPSKEYVTIKIYDILGKQVNLVLNEEQPPGRHSVKWNAVSFPSGMYFYRIAAGNFTETKKLLLVK